MKIVIDIEGNEGDVRVVLNQMISATRLDRDALDPLHESEEPWEPPTITYHEERE